MGEGVPDELAKVTLREEQEVGPVSSKTSPILDGSGGEGVTSEPGQSWDILPSGESLPEEEKLVTTVQVAERILKVL